ncbi:uncharacterized protein LOC108107755 [Drosophila eugracilis]|uniref:uncharacterized protein LOC108107755 n=1 Tax=Drosophila eugracilis TaxID=29029 RepID=UPI001BDA4679|nr:uncharacterized protein LOC108107755 [Drosophila eugracilis]
MQEDACQQVIARNVPLLVRLLLDSPIDDGKKDVGIECKIDSATFESCLNYAQNYLAHSDHEECSPEGVWINMNHFLERFRSERLAEFGKTFQQLANVVLNHPICQNHIQPNLQWRLMDFLLHVNYKAFHEVHRNYHEMEQKRKNILEAVTMATESSDVVREELRKAKVSLAVIARQDTGKHISPSSSQHLCKAEIKSTAEILPINFPSAKEEQSDSVELPEQTYSTYVKPQSNKIQVKDKFVMKDARLELELNLTQDESAAEKASQVTCFREDNDLLSRIKTPWWHVDVHVYHQPRILASSFTRGYGDFLIYQLRECHNSLRRTSEEHQLLNELVIFFFTNPNDSHLDMLNEKMELQISEPSTCALRHLLEGPHLDRVVSLVKKMIYLREMIETHAIKRISGDRVETLTFLSISLRRLLRPVMEFLVYYERRLTRGTETPTLQHFIETTKEPLQRISLLYELSKDNKEDHPSVRSLRILNSLLSHSTRSTQPKLMRSLSASLLLHSLQAYCQFLDSWWSTGELSDWYEEFPYQSQRIDGRTEYTLREICIEKKEELKSDLIDIIQGHIFESSQAVAVLYDTRKLGEFNSLHFIAPQESLHTSLMKAVLQEVIPYQTELLEENSYVPDILQQLEATEQITLRRLFYSFYMETRPDPLKPVGCSIEAMIRNFEVCASYTPISEIIIKELQRLLQRRSLVANSYVADLINDLHKIVKHLRSVYLHLNYDLFRNEFKMLFMFLERNKLMEASIKLREIVVSQDTQLGYLFQVRLCGPHPDNISLRIHYDPLLNRVVTQDQIEEMSSYFRLLLNMHFSLYQLKHLPSLDNSKQQQLVEALKSLQVHLRSIIKEQLSNLDKAFKRLQNLYSYETGFNEFTVLTELRQIQEVFIFQMKEKLQKEFEEGRHSFGGEEVLNISTILVALWLRVSTLIADHDKQKTSNIWEVKYERLSYHYLRCTLRKCKAIGCFLGQG